MIVHFPAQSCESQDRQATRSVEPVLRLPALKIQPRALGTQLVLVLAVEPLDVLCYKGSELLFVGGHVSQLISDSHPMRSNSTEISRRIACIHLEVLERRDDICPHSLVLDFETTPFGVTTDCSGASSLVEALVDILGVKRSLR